MHMANAALKQQYDNFCPAMQQLLREAIENAIHTIHDMYDTDDHDPDELLDAYSARKVATVAIGSLAQMLYPMSLNRALVSQQMADALKWLAVDKVFLKVED